MTAAFAGSFETQEVNFLAIQDAFLIFSSIFYIWTLVNIHTTMAKNQIQSDNCVMGLFIVFLFFYLLITISFSVSHFLVDTTSFGYQVANYCFGYAYMLVFVLFNIFICHLLISMSKPLTVQQNASLTKHLYKRNNVLMDVAESKQVLA